MYGRQEFLLVFINTSIDILTGEYRGSGKYKLLDSNSL